VSSLLHAAFLNEEVKMQGGHGKERSLKFSPSRRSVFQRVKTVQYFPTIP